MKDTWRGKNETVSPQMMKFSLDYTERRFANSGISRANFEMFDYCGRAVCSKFKKC